jgi:hypothetical protein
MKKIVAFTAIAISLALGACASVDVTKTAKGFYQATDPNTVEILKTRPAKNFDELGTITVSGFDADETAKMHNAIRAKSAPLGANAVILTEEGLVKDGLFSYKRWATGVAVVYK